MKYWSNAVFLLRKDTGKLLRADMVQADGKAEDFVVWDANRGGILTWCSDENRYYTGADGAAVDPMLSTTCKVALLDGTEVECWTVFDAIDERMREYTPRMASEVSGVPERKIKEAARL